jgi:hypothetical protein
MKKKKFTAHEKAVRVLERRIADLEQRERDTAQMALAVTNKLHVRHWPHGVLWRPAETAVGLLEQIDDMCAHLTRYPMPDEYYLGSPGRNHLADKLRD